MPSKQKTIYSVGAKFDGRLFQEQLVKHSSRLRPRVIRLREAWRAKIISPDEQQEEEKEKRASDDSHQNRVFIGGRVTSERRSVGALSSSSSCCWLLFSAPSPLWTRASKLNHQFVGAICRRFQSERNDACCWPRERHTIKAARL